MAESRQSKSRASHSQGQGRNVGTSSSGKVSKEDIERILKKGVNWLSIQVFGEVSYLFRGQELTERMARGKQILTLSPGFTPYDFMRKILFSDKEALKQLLKPEVESLIAEALVEARIYTMYLTSLHVSLIYMTVMKMTSQRDAHLLEYFLLLIEAIVNNRLTNASHLDAFLMYANEISAGKKTWSSFRPENYAPTRYGLPCHFFRQKELFRTYHTVLRMVKNWLTEEQSGMQSFIKNTKEIEITVQIFANHYTPKICNCIPVIAKGIAKGLIRNVEDVKAAVEIIHQNAGSKSISYTTLQERLSINDDSFYTTD